MPTSCKVLQEFKAERTPSPQKMASIGLRDLSPIAEVMVRFVLFLDPPAHTRIRELASSAFTPHRVAVLREHVRAIVNDLLDAVEPYGRMDVIADLADPLPYPITAEMLGVPVADAPQLKAWSVIFAEILGNFQHSPERAGLVAQTLEAMELYFRDAADARKSPRPGLIQSFLSANVNGDRFTDDEVVANTMITMVGGQETTTNLIGNGLLTLLRHPFEFDRLRNDLSLIPSAIEEMLRFEPPIQQTDRAGHVRNH
jgi:cytochrome P450